MAYGVHYLGIVEKWMAMYADLYLVLWSRLIAICLLKLH